MTPAEAGVHARRHPDTVRRALAAGDLHGVQRVPGGRWLLDPGCVDAWAAGVPCEHRRRRDGERLRAVVRRTG